MTTATASRAARATSAATRRQAMRPAPWAAASWACRPWATARASCSSAGQAPAHLGRYDRRHGGALPEPAPGLLGPLLGLIAQPGQGLARGGLLRGAVGHGLALGEVVYTP